LRGPEILALRKHRHDPGIPTSLVPVDIILAQQARNTITFDNHSGTDAVVKLVGAANQLSAFQRDRVPA